MREACKQPKVKFIDYGHKSNRILKHTDLTSQKSLRPRVLFRTKSKNDVMFGGLLLGVTGVLIGVVVNSWLAITIAGGLGVLIGCLVGWLGGRTYLLIICFGVLLGAFLGYRTGDRDILIMASGSGGAIAGFFGAQVQLFLKKK